MEISAHGEVLGQVQGHTAPGFEAVREVFARNFSDNIEVGASFCVLQHGTTVVDLWGGFRDRAGAEPWCDDTLVNVYSTTKGPAAVALATVVEAGDLDYVAPVADYWPELRAARGGLTVAQMLSHQAGICGVREPLQVTDLYDWAAMRARLERAEPLWEPGTAMGYHAIVWGFLVGELVLRTTGKTLGQVLRERICAPLGADFHLGVSDADLDRIAPLIGPNHARGQTAATARSNTESVTRPALNAMALENPLIRPYQDVFSRPWQQAEIAASNGHASGRGIARIYGALAAGGELDGVRILQPQSIDAMCVQEWGMEPDLVLGRSLRRGRGVILNTFLQGEGMFGPNPESYGHTGTGGSLGFADPKMGLGIGYAMNQLHGSVAGATRAQRLVAAVYGCLGVAEHASMQAPKPVPG
jgi:CubicO group peptidase (beta-lactamase class C family)